MRKIFILLLFSLLLSGCEGMKQSSSQNSDKEKVNNFIIKIGGGSNSPTLNKGDSASYRKNFSPSELKIGMLVVYPSPFKFDPVLTSTESPPDCRRRIREVAIGSKVYKEEISPFLGSKPACDMMVGRIVGLPGDTVVVNPKGEVSVNDKSLSENYISEWCKLDSRRMSKCNTLVSTVPENKVFILGDNRANAWDSRRFPGGAGVPIDEIIGMSVKPL